MPTVQIEVSHHELQYLHQLRRAHGPEPDLRDLATKDLSDPNGPLPQRILRARVLLALPELPYIPQPGDVLRHTKLNVSPTYRVLYRHTNGDLFVEVVRSYVTPHLETALILARHVGDYERVA